MVAITVILAAVIAAFVLDLGPSETDPQAAVQIDGDGTSNVTVTLQSFNDADGIAVVSDDGNIQDFGLDTVQVPTGSDPVYIDTTSMTGSSISIDGNEQDSSDVFWIDTQNEEAEFDVIVYSGEDPDPGVHEDLGAIDDDNAITVVVIDSFTVERTAAP